MAARGPMKALYICDEKEEWNHIKSLFNRNFPKIELTCVLSGDDAIEHLSYEGPFIMIIIETSLRTDHPSELARKLLPLTGEKPYVFIGAKVHINDRVEESLYIRSEMNEIILRPIEPPNFVKTIQKCVDWAKEEEFEKSIEEIDKEELLPMKIRSFYLFNKLPYDVFVELTSTKYVKVITAEKKYLHAEINAYAKKRIKFLYLRKNEYLKFLEDSIEALMQAFSSNKLNAKMIITNQIRSALIIHQYIKSVGVTDDIINLVDKSISMTRGVLLEHKKFRSVLQFFPQKSNDLAEQAIMVMYLCESMLATLGWASETSRKKLGLASLLYDSMLDDDELYKIRSLHENAFDLLPEDLQKNFENHPALAAKIAANFQGYPEADFIVAQHHERPKGEGFPNKLSTNKLSAHSCIFILATTFISHFTEERDKEKVAPLNIFRELKGQFNVGNFKEPLQALQKSIV